MNPLDMVSTTVLLLFCSIINYPSLAWLKWIRARRQKSRKRENEAQQMPRAFMLIVAVKNMNGVHEKIGDCNLDGPVCMI